MEITVESTGRLINRSNFIFLSFKADYLFTGWVAALILAAAASGVIGWIWVPSRSVPTPSITILSPGFNPEVTTKFLPSSNLNTSTSVFFTFESASTTNTKRLS